MMTSAPTNQASAVGPRARRFRGIGASIRARSTMIGFCAFACASSIGIPDIARSETPNAAIKVYTALPVARPDYPAPKKTKRLLFYVQRSLNANTVVYEANLKPNGDYDRDKPLLIRWRSFATSGNLNELSWLEKWVYGVTVKRGDRSTNHMRIHMTTYPERTATIGIDKSGAPIATLRVGKYTVKMIYIFVQLKNKRFIPSIEYVDIVGQDLASGAYIRERVRTSSWKYAPGDDDIVNTR